MSNLEQVETDILSWLLSEFERLRVWLFELDYGSWDEQLEQDIADGKVEIPAQEAIILKQETS